MGKRLTTLRVTALLGLVLAFQAACKKPPAGSPGQPTDSTAVLQRPRMSPSLPGNIDSVSDTAIIAYIKKLTFVPDTEAGDRQALLLGHYPASAKLGPVATILPEANSYQGSLEDLRRNGKVIAKIEMDPIGAQPYPKLGLVPRATTYWWVQLNATGYTGRSIFITVDSTDHIVKRVPSDLHVKPDNEHMIYRGIQGLARFVWNPADEGTWGTCNGACCAKN